MRVLILGGTTEASRLAEALAARSDIASILSLAGRTAHPVPPPIPFRIGGFGGAEGLAAYLHTAGIAAVIDATHPFAVRISANAVTACARGRIPLVTYSRAPWQPGEGDLWTSAPDIGAAVAILRAKHASTVFLTTGRLDLEAFRAAPQHRYIIRAIDQPDSAICPPIAEIVLGRGPFPIENELGLLRSRAVELVVTKNSGGSASAAKLAAARQLRVPVLMVERPAVQGRPMLDDVDAVLRWIDAHGARP